MLRTDSNERIERSNPFDGGEIPDVFRENDRYGLAEHQRGQLAVEVSLPCHAPLHTEIECVSGGLKG